MKKYLLMIVITALAFVQTGCSWIEEKPDSLITPEKVEDSADGARQWVTGVYSKWIYDMFCWGYFPKVLEIDADYISGPDWLFNKFGAGNFQGESDVTDALWKGCYGLIARANLAEQEINKMKNLTPEQRNNAIGEVQFQRAFAYFLLVRAYGELPIQSVTIGNNPNAIGNPRVAIQQVYDGIIADLTSAVVKLYPYGMAELGHVSAGSAAGLLAKVYATMAAAAMPTGTNITVRTGAAYTTVGGKKQYAPLESKVFAKNAVQGYEDMKADSLYKLSLAWAEKLLNGEYGTYTLLPYDQLWKKTSATASEFLFSIGSVNADAKYKTSVHTQYEGYFYEQGGDFLASGGWVGCTRHWYDLFDHDDYRITKGVKHRWRYTFHEASHSGFYYPQTDEYAIMATGYDLNGNKHGEPTGIYADGVSYYYSYDSQCLAFTTKYEDVTDKTIENADANFPMLRLADVILIAAEAANEIGQSDKARTYLNQVRERSNAVMASTMSKDAMRSMIIEERAKELACEADRRWDLIRWGIYVDAMNALGGKDDSGVNKNREERNVRYPLPISEINTNPNINSNNAGWN